MADEATVIDPNKEQQLRFQAMLIANVIGSVAQIYTQNDRALGFTIMFALQNMTGKYWDENLAFYRSMKGERMAIAPSADQFEAMVRHLREDLLQNAPV